MGNSCTSRGGFGICHKEYFRGYWLSSRDIADMSNPEFVDHVQEVSEIFPSYSNDETRAIYSQHCGQYQCTSWTGNLATLKVPSLLGSHEIALISTSRFFIEDGGFSDSTTEIHFMLKVHSKAAYDGRDPVVVVDEDFLPCTEEGEDRRTTRTGPAPLENSKKATGMFSIFTQPGMERARRRSSRHRLNFTIVYRWIVQSCLRSGQIQVLLSPWLEIALLKDPFRFK